jgi:hypothetical protein
MDGLIVIRSVTLSNYIAKTRRPEGVMISYCQALRGVVEITLSHLGKNEGNKEPALVEGMRRSIHMISFQRIPKTI